VIRRRQKMRASGLAGVGAGRGGIGGFAKQTARAPTLEDWKGIGR
jgi:hypothetical protein